MKLKLNVILPTWDMSRARTTAGILQEWGTPDLDVVPIYAPETSAVDNMLTGGELPADIIAFLHDDVEVHEEGWDKKVVDWFKTHPKCGMVGFGGATGLGTDSLYKERYDYHQLARLNFISNMVDAETHGTRVEEPTRVVVLDGFSQIIRREAYAEVGGWKTVRNMGITFHMYDAAMACLMAEKGWEVWMLPLLCSHSGGRTSTSKHYDGWLRRQGVNGDQQVHSEAHKIIYRRFKHILPLRLEE